MTSTVYSNPSEQTSQAALIKPFDVLMGAPPQVNLAEKTVTLSSCQVYYQNQFCTVPMKMIAGVPLTEVVEFEIFVSRNKPHRAVWDRASQAHLYREHARRKVFILRNGDWQEDADAQVFLIEDYFSRFQSSSNYQEILFRAGKPLQSAELNDLQKQTYDQTKKLGDSLFDNGDVIRGGVPNVLSETQEVEIAPSWIYLDGAVRHLEEKKLKMPEGEDFELGIYLKYELVSPEMDPGLRDPATSYANSDQEGAYRLRAETTWGWSCSQLNGSGYLGKFCVVHRFKQRKYVNSHKDVEQDMVSQSIASYNSDLWGDYYVVEGLKVDILEQSERGSIKEHANSVFYITQGKAFVQGFEVDLHAGLTLSVAPNVCVKRARITLNDLSAASFPVPLCHQIIDITYLKEQEITNQIYISSASKHPVPDLARVIEVYSYDAQGHKKIFQQDQDYIAANDHLIWQDKNHPETGKTFHIRYYCQKYLTSSEYRIENNLFTPLLAEKPFSYEINYEKHQERIDFITINKKGQLACLYGGSGGHRPHVPGDHLILAHVEVDSQPRRVFDVATRSLSMSHLNMMQQRIDHLFHLLAEERLARRAETKDKAQGLLTDSFYSHTMRDFTQEHALIEDWRSEDSTQLMMHAEIEEGLLQLPLEFADEDILDLEVPGILLPVASTSAVVSQSKHTSSMKINPYSAFEPLPALVTLSPQVDNWTESRVERLADRVNSRTVRVSNQALNGRLIRTHRTQETSERLESMDTLRSRQVHFSISGFGGKQKLAQVLFDGIDVTHTVKLISPKNSGGNA